MRSLRNTLLRCEPDTMGLHATESTPREWSLLRSRIDITVGSDLVTASVVRRPLLPASNFAPAFGAWERDLRGGG